MTTAPLSPDCLIAVATKTGQQIDMHFGHADDFAIYAVRNGTVAFLEKREVEHYCQGGHGDEDKREVILRALADCRALFVARIGGGPGTRLREAGIEPVDDYPYGAPEASIVAWLASQNG
ncbi:MAG: NifB/NifX family molybdenum-iron cluster-binding protein [Ferribacterium limneticum]